MHIYNVNLQQNPVAFSDKSNVKSDIDPTNLLTHM